MIIVILFGGLIYLQKGMPYRYPVASSVLLAIDETQQLPKFKETIKILSYVDNDKIATVGNGNNQSFILWGDSHARALIPAISATANKTGLSGFIVCGGTRPPFLGVDIIGQNSSYLYQEGVVSFIKAHSAIKTVILAGNWERYAIGHKYMLKEDLRLKDMKEVNSFESNPALFKIGLTRTVNTILALGRRVIIVSDVPEIGYSAPRLFWIKNIFNKNIKNLLPTIIDYHKYNNNAESLLNSLSLLHNVTILHPEKMLFDENDRLMIMANKQILYSDADHLSREGALFISPIFDKSFMEMANAM